MNVDKNLLSYLRQNFDSDTEIIKYTKNNALYYSIAYMFDIDVEKQFYFKTNGARYKKYFDSFVEIHDVFAQYQVTYSISFKGLVLAEVLYENPLKRYVGDIDVFVSRDDFPIALMSLIKIGYTFRDKRTFYNEHHIVMIRDNVVVELHKNIYNPCIGINEEFLLSNTRKIKISNVTVRTFNITAMFLHLIYHLYMDTWLIGYNLYNFFLRRPLPKARRFLYRAYEIAMFSEKYFDEINWEAIGIDISTQKLRVIFKKMILDIIEIFPNAFPDSFLQTVFHLEYVDDERDQLYKYLIDSEIKEGDKNIDYILSKYINDNWEVRGENNIYKKVGETISLTKESPEEAEQTLNCIIDTEITIGGLKIVFKVSNDDFYISETDNYDTQASDGVHLLLCGTEQYSYNSIFFFPKLIDGKIRVVVCDVLNNRNQILPDDLIKAEFSKLGNAYTITAMLGNKFLKENNLNSYLYMGLVISDCSSETHRRKNQLILSEEDSQWYNPTYFAKIDME